MDGDSDILFRWEGGVWLSPAFLGPWHQGDSLERSDAKRVSPFDSMLISPCRSGGHAAAFAHHQRGARPYRAPPRSDFSRVRAVSKRLR